MSVPNPQPPLPSPPSSSGDNSYNPDYGTNVIPQALGGGVSDGPPLPNIDPLTGFPYPPPGADTGGGTTVGGAPATDTSGSGSGAGSGGSAGGTATGGGNAAGGFSGYGLDQTSQSLASGIISGAIDSAGQSSALNSILGSLSPADVAALGGAASTVDGVRNSIAGQATSGVGGCYDCVNQTKNYIVEKVMKPLIAASQCRCNCDQSLQSQLLAGYTGAAGQTAGVAAAAGQYVPGYGQLPEAPFIAESFAAASATSQPYVPGGTPAPVPPVPSVPPPPPVATCTTTPPPCPTDWEGFCNQETGIVVARPVGSPPLPPNWVKVSLAHTEQQAIAEAQANCPAAQDRKKKFAPLSSPPYAGVPNASCDLSIYQDEAKLRSTLLTVQADIVLTDIYDQIANANNAVGTLISGLPVAGTLVELWKQQFKHPTYICDVILPIITNMLGCHNEIFLDAARAMNVIAFWEHQTGFDAGQFKKSFEYTMNQQCRIRQLEPDRAVAAYMADSIDRGQLETHWGIAGYCPDSLKWYLQAAKAKPIPAELVRMRMRDVITPSDYHAGMRRLGYLERENAENIFEINYEIPQTQDIIRFMVRDADDNEIVQSLGMDNLFDKKFGPQLQEWAKHNGVSTEQMKYSWRSHWTIPGPQQLFEFWHRLRRKTEFGSPETQRLDIQRALIHNDILPHWFDKYFAVQYKVVPFRQLARIYNQGAIKDDELFQAITENGYSDEVAKKLADFFKRLKDDAAVKTEEIKLWLELSIDPDECRKRLKTKGYSDETITQTMQDAESGFSKSDYVRAFVGGEFPKASVAAALLQAGVTQAGIDRICDLAGLRVRRTLDLDQFEDGTLDSLDCKTNLVEYGIPSDRADELIADVQQRVESRRDKACVASIRRKYFLGFYDQGGPDNDLIGIGIVPERVTILKSQWECEAAARDKAIPLAKLAGWLRDGVIGPVDFVRRVRNLGFSTDDANQLLSDALQNISIQQQKAAEKQAKDQQAAASRAAKAAEQGAAKLIRQQAQLKTARDKAAAAKLRREKTLLHAANLVQKQCTCDVATAVYAVQEEHAWIKNVYAFTEDEALQVLVTAGEKFKKGSPADYHAIVQADAELLAAANEPSTDVAGQDIVSSNGSTVPSA